VKKLFEQIRCIQNSRRGKTQAWNWEMREKKRKEICASKPENGRPPAIVWCPIGSPPSYRRSRRDRLVVGRIFGA